MRELYNVGDIKKQNGPDAIRTHDLWFRKPLLYPAELRSHLVILFECTYTLL